MKSELEKIFEEFEKKIPSSNEDYWLQVWQLKSQLKSLIQAKDEKIKELEETNKASKRESEYWYELLQKAQKTIFKLEKEIENKNIEIRELKKVGEEDLKAYIEAKDKLLEQIKQLKQLKSFKKSVIEKEV